MSNKRFLFVSWDSLIGDIAWQTVKEGHEVKYYIQQPEEREIADGFVPNSPEFSVPFDGATYICQRAEHLGTGEVRIYHVIVGDWGNVQFVSRPR